MDEARPTHEEVRAALAAICDSQVFANKKTLPDLLTCIVNYWLAGEDIKEEVLRVEVFKRDSKSADSTIVRTNAINLRAALAEYYDHEGRRDEVRISVPRGEYNAQISYSVTVRERAELDRREAALEARERELERRHAAFNQQVEDSEALYKKREALNVARHAEVDQKLADLEKKLIAQIEDKARMAESSAREREKKMVEDLKTTIGNCADFSDGGF